MSLDLRRIAQPIGLYENLCCGMDLLGGCQARQADLALQGPHIDFVRSLIDYPAREGRRVPVLLGRPGIAKDTRSAIGTK